jgi:hypothetical protein
MGHSKGKDVTQAVYTEKCTPKELFDDVISKIDFSIDLFSGYWPGFQHSAPAFF